MKINLNEILDMEKISDKNLESIYKEFSIKDKKKILISFENSEISLLKSILYNTLSLKEKYNFLIEEITKHDELYEMNIPEIDDGQYDDLYFELLTLENNNPQIISKKSPSQKVNTVLVDSLEQKKHATPMLSQNKIKTKEEIEKFIEKDISKEVLGQEKLDGLTIVLTYNEGELKEAVTRGNGYIGEVVTHNLKTFKNVPQKISFKNELVLRAEALILIKEFEKINITGEYSNPRNLASGTIRQLNSKICEKRNMIAKIFEIVSVEGKNFEKDSEQLEWVRSLGFDIVSYQLFERDSEILNKIYSFVDEYANNKRKTLEYMIDGLVFKSNDLKEREKLGYTSKWPKWATAYKFKAMEATTVLRKVINQVGKTGVITPVAIFDKVNIDTNIEKATIHNYGIIKALDLKIGDTITVIKSNDVIPKISNVIKNKRSGHEIEIKAPDVCPVCGSKVEIINDLLYCTGINCPAQIKETLKQFCSRNALNITGLGKETINDFYDTGILRKIEDIYNLENHKDEICNMPKMGLKKYQNIILSVENSKTMDFNNLLLGLSIKLIGDSRAKDIAKHFKNIDNILESVKNKEDFFEECLSLDDFGPERTTSLYNYFTNPDNINLINYLKSKGVNMKTFIQKEEENVFIKDKIFVITGETEIWKNRKDLKIFIENHGGKCSGSVSKKTSYLINNDNTSQSSKNKTAKELNIPIITEIEFKNLLENNI